MKKELITTNLEYPKNKTNKFYLGNWCNDNDQIIPYHWTKIKKKEKDYKYINRLKQKLLKSISKVMNKHHNVNRSNKYWNIILGPWLNITITTLYDKWCNIERINKVNFFTKEFVVNKKNLIPNDFDEFAENLNSDIWNHYFYSEILKFKNYDVKKSKKKLYIKKKNISYKHTNIKNKLINIYLKLSKLVNKFFPKNKYFFYETGNIKKEFLYQIKLGQIPRIYNFKLNLKKIIDIKKRNELKIQTISVNNFEKFLSKYLMFFIPLSYLENFIEIEKFYFKNIRIKKNSIISSSNAHYSNDYFKIWLAGQIANGSKLILFQHGGCNGIVKFYWPLKHSLDISDYYISYGWKNNENKVKPFGNIYLHNKIKAKKKINLLFVLNTELRYSSYLGAKPISSGVLKDLEGNINLLNNLDKKVFKKTFLRLSAYDYEWNWKYRFKKKIRDIKFCDDTGLITNLYSTSKIVVHCYNATSLLETINLNIPTVIYLEKDLYYLSNSSKKIFKLLKEAGIFHDNFISASEHINRVWDDVDNWWEDPNTQNAVKQFKKKYISPFKNNDKQIIKFFQKFKNN